MKRLPTDGTFLLAMDIPLDATEESFAITLTELGIPVSAAHVSIKHFPKRNMVTALISISKQHVADLINLQLAAQGATFRFRPWAAKPQAGQQQNLPPLTPMSMA